MVRLKSVQLANWRKHEAVTFDLDHDVVAIVGENTAGKSSVLEAIEYALTGQARVLHGRDAQEIVRDDQPGGFVTLTADPLLKPLQRMISWGPKHGIQATIESALGYPAELMSLCLNPQRWVDLSDAELFALMGRAAGLDDAKVREAFIAAGWDATVLGVPTSPAEAKAAYAALYTMRTAANKDVKAAGPGPCPPASVAVREILEDADVPAASITSASVMRELARGVDALREARAKAPGADGARQALEQALVDEAAAKARVDALDGRLTEFQTELAGYGDIEALRDKIVAIEKAEHRPADAPAGKGVVTIDQALEGERLFLTYLQARLATASESETIACPLCGGACTFESRAFAKNRVKERLAQIKGYQKKGATSTLPLGKTDREDLGVLKMRLERADWLVGECKNLMAQHEKEAANVKGLGDRVAELRDAAHQVDTDAQDRIQEIAEAVDDLRHYAEALRAWEENSERAAAKRRTAETLDRMVKACEATSGVLARLYVEELEPYIELLNDILAAWGYRIVDGWRERFALGPVGKRARPLVQSSGSERYRAGVALAYAFAVVTGFGLILVDDADILDGAGREALLAGQFGGGRKVQMIVAGKCDSIAELMDEIDGQGLPAGMILLGA